MTPASFLFSKTYRKDTLKSFRINLANQPKRRNQDVLIDNGIGIPVEKLAEIRKELAKGIDSDFSIGYGLYNVNKRLLLYYGNNQKPITIDSKYREGTTVTLTIPISPKTIGGNKHV